MFLPGSSSIFRDAFRGIPNSPTLNSSPQYDTMNDTEGQNGGLGGPNAPRSAPVVNPEEVKQMHEEEFQRRLRGEYIEAQQRLGSVVCPCRWDFEGIKLIHR